MWDSVTVVQNCEGGFYGKKKSKTSTPRKGLDSESGENPFKTDLSPVVEKDISQEHLGKSDSVVLIPDIKLIGKNQKILTECQVNAGAGPGFGQWGVPSF